jgi:hypothetical protein
MDTFNPNQMPPMPPVENKKSIAPLISVIVILVLIIVGGLYFLKERSNQQVYTPVQETAPQGDSVTASLKQQSSSDDLNSIESDLNATNLNNLDQGAAAIQAELQ